MISIFIWFLYISLRVLCILICLAWIDGGRAVFHAYPSLITQVRAAASLLFLRDFPKVSLHINTFMHLVNRAAITVALGVMHCHACKSYRILRRVAKVAEPSLLSISHPFLCISFSLSFVLVCAVVRDTRCPEWGFTLLFSFRAETRLWADSSRHNKLCAMSNAGPGRQAARRAMCRKMSVARLLSLFPTILLSLPRSGRLLLYRPSIKTPHCQTVPQPQMGVELTSHVQNALPGGDGRTREGLKTSSRGGEKIGASVQRWLINKVVS